MADMMTFPDTWEEFEELYHITDTEQIYTNGARLIPSFRVEQWLEHIADRNSSEKPNNCETCLYRYVPWDAPICDSCTMANSHYEKDEFEPKAEPQTDYRITGTIGYRCPKCGRGNFLKNESNCFYCGEPLIKTKSQTETHDIRTDTHECVKTEPQIIACPIQEEDADYARWLYKDEPQTERSGK